jgi:5'-nucleotidase
MEKPLILVTNDDGMFAPGIKSLVEVVKDIGKVIVVAPNSPQSGQGHAITINEPLRLNKVEAFPGVEAYECSGTPADCVKLAKNVLLKGQKIDLCVSGINHGSNASINIIYSGTMSAAMEASIEGIDSIGFSLLDYSFQADFIPAQHYARIIIESVLANKLEYCKLLNVNIPKLSIDEIKGIKVCRQGTGNWVEDFKESQDPRNQKYYWLSGEFITDKTEKDSDNWALENGYVSVVPSWHDLTKQEAIEPLKYLEDDRKK